MELLFTGKGRPGKGQARGIGSSGLNRYSWRSLLEAEQGGQVGAGCAGLGFRGPSHPEDMKLVASGSQVEERALTPRKIPSGARVERSLSPRPPDSAWGAEADLAHAQPGPLRTQGHQTPFQVSKPPP